MTMQQDNRKKRAVMLPYIPRRVVFLNGGLLEDSLLAFPCYVS